MRKLLLFLLATCLAVPVASVTVHTIGDSTMCNYKDDEERRGWCQLLQMYLEGITVNNRALSGRSSKQFYNEEWPDVKKDFQSGDYLIIQFAHNDEKGNGLDRDEVIELIGNYGSVNDRGTCPYSTYHDYLKKYINEAREAGVTPILVSSICRSKFNADGTVTRSGQHDLGDNYKVVDVANKKVVNGTKLDANNHKMDYTENMRLVAEEMNVQYVDLMSATKKEWERIYAEGGKSTVETYFRSGDETHVNEKGAILVGKLAVQAMYDADVLRPYIKKDAISSGITLTEVHTEPTISYYTLDGKQIDSPDGAFHGICIEKRRYADNSVKTVKVVR